MSVLTKCKINGAVLKIFKKSVMESNKNVAKRTAAASFVLPYMF